jgi:regulator of protease activity HflC (stomatin/prohibitin superfamily)
MNFQILHGVNDLPASIRVIKIVKNPMSGEEAYTLEFEVEAEESKDLVTELTSSPYGQRLIELLNMADFLPEIQVKTKDEIKAEAEAEEKAISEREEELKAEGKKKGIEELMEFINTTFGEEQAKEIEAKFNEKTEEEEKKKKEKIVLIGDEGREPE